MLSILSLGTWSKSLSRTASHLSSLSRSHLQRYLSPHFSLTIYSNAVRPEYRGKSDLSTPNLDYAFAFDIDGVLMLGSSPIPAGARALKMLHARRIPYILLTNGGGKYESDRVAELSHHLGVNVQPTLRTR